MFQLQILLRRMYHKPTAGVKIDLQNLYHISGGDDEFVRQMLASFINTTGKGLKEMQDAAISKKWETVADLAHKILSPCRHIGAMDLYNLLSKIEKSIRNNNVSESIEAMTRKSLKEFEIVSEAINEHISKLK